MIINRQVQYPPDLILIILLSLASPFYVVFYVYAYMHIFMHVYPCHLHPASRYLWPNARTSVMGGDQAANVLATVHKDNLDAAGKSWSAEEEAAFKQPILDKYDKESHAFYSRYVNHLSTRSSLRSCIGFVCAFFHTAIPHCLRIDYPFDWSSDT
jgi:hypothetical protein